MIALQGNDDLSFRNRGFHLRQRERDRIPIGSGHQDDEAKFIAFHFLPDRNTSLGEQRIQSWSATDALGSLSPLPDDLDLRLCLQIFARERLHLSVGKYQFQQPGCE